MAIRRRDKIILGLVASILFALLISIISVAIFYLVSWRRGIEAIQEANRALIAGEVARQRADLETAAKMERNCQIIALNSLAWLLATTPNASIRDGKYAIEIATQACERSQWSYSSYIDTLAAAYAEAGDFDSAVKFEQMATARLAGHASLKADYEKRLHLFQAGNPYREEETKR